MMGKDGPLNKDPFAGGIYAILNKKNGDCYIGSAKVLVSRFVQHRRDLMLGRSFPLIQAAWNEFGKDAFVFKILETVQSSGIDHIWSDEFEEELRKCEQYWIDLKSPKYNRHAKSGRGPMSERRKEQVAIDLRAMGMGHVVKSWRPAPKVVHPPSWYKYARRRG